MFEQVKAKKSFVVNESTLKGKWKETKGELRRLWGNLTDDELEKARGDFTSIEGIIQKKYGETKESIQDKLATMFDGLEEKVGQAKDVATEAIDKVQTAVAKATENVKDKLN